jgi:hypothetical protein
MTNGFASKPQNLKGKWAGPCLWEPATMTYMRPWPSDTLFLYPMVRNTIGLNPLAHPLRTALCALLLFFFSTTTRSLGPDVTAFSTERELLNGSSSLSSSYPTPQRQADRLRNSVEMQPQSQEEFEERFLRLEPAEQVRSWREGKPYADIMEDVLIAQGVDAVRYVVRIIRDPKQPIFHRWRAMKLLCDMDRFVPDHNLPIPEAGGEIYVLMAHLSGVVNRNVPVDGRRIGTEGYQALQWAAEQTSDKELRFHARDLLGLLAEELQPLPLQEKIKRWANAIIKNRGNGGGIVAPDQYIVGATLSKQLICSAPESIPLFSNLLKESSSGYVRQATIDLLEDIDEFKVRLRGIPEGQEAIKAVEEAIKKGNLGPIYARRSERDGLWNEFSGKVLNDDGAFQGIPLSMSFYLVPLAFDHFYGDKNVLTLSPGPQLYFPADWLKFVRFLTKTDPYFPSWEYCHVGRPDFDQVLEPRFRARIERLREQWIRFRASEPVGRVGQPLLVGPCLHNLYETMAE